MIRLCSSNIVMGIFGVGFVGIFGNWGEMFWLLFMRYGVLFHLGCLWTLTCSRVGGGAFK